MLTLLALSLLAIPPDLSFGGHATLKPDDALKVSTALESGWHEFARISGTAIKMPEIAETTYAKARVAVNYNNSPVSAIVQWYDNGANPYIFISNPLFNSYSETNRAHVITHELFHFYYNLPDHHRGRAMGNHPECVMDNFFVAGWTGNLCQGCRAMIK